MKSETFGHQKTRPLAETNWLVDRLHTPDLRIVDCSVMLQVNDDGSRKYHSGKADWEAGHIPGCTFIDILADLGPRYDPTVPLMAPLDDFAKAMEACGIGDGNQVVLYDRSNHAWAACIWWMLRVCGFDNAAVLNGGWQKWTVEKRPVSTQPAPYPHGSLTVKRQPHLMATKQQVMAAISNDKTKIINALPADNHSGEVVRFPRPGRIAGSVNVDCDLVTDPGAHTFLPEDRLRELFDSVDALNVKRVITYCGGGVAASLDALTVTLLGGPDVAVYHGSLAEWTEDPDLPMETG
ncbi:MAG: sulfurtransferase [Roseobacter sp.]